MKLKFLANQRQHKSFDYSPMYYDARKERIDLKKKEFERIENTELHSEERSRILRQNLQESWARGEYSQKKQFNSSLRVLALVALLLLLGYFVFNGVDNVEQVVKKL